MSKRTIHKNNGDAKPDVEKNGLSLNSNLGPYSIYKKKVLQKSKEKVKRNFIEGEGLFEEVDFRMEGLNLPKNFNENVNYKKDVDKEDG